jgi:hypothetical protein
MDPITMAMLGATAAGAITSVLGSHKKHTAQKAVLQDELAAEENRRRQMELNTLNNQRALIRNQQQAQAQGISNANASGASLGSSAAQGAQGQIQGQAGVESNKLYQNLQIGETAFNINKKMAQDKMKAQEGQSLADLGNMIGGMSAPIGRLTGQIFPGQRIGNGMDPMGG